MSYFVINKTVNNQYRFGFFASNHEQILASETYQTKQGCQNGIASVKRIAPSDSSYDRKDAYLNYRFNMVAGNNEIVAHSSEGYTTAHAREHAIGIVKRDASTAPIYDRS